MKYVRVSIHKGRLSLGFYYDEARGLIEDPGLEYQIFDEEGREVHSDYTGEVAWSEHNGRTYITPNKGHEIHVFHYVLAEKPTTESVEYRNGWVHAMKMKRRVWPKNKSDQFVEGFRSAWQARERAEARSNPTGSGGSMVDWWMSR